ncbi:MAG: hypothetical protein HYW25_06060 [Candidatus Aenigmarchaeota archaeon]|nr:hypothetical protein [Candidatus Aenigmarchaeota archaeon]
MNARMVLLLSVILLSAGAYALSEDAKKASIAVEDASAAVQEMIDEGISTQRVEDILSEARIILEVQTQQEGNGSSPDFSGIIKKTQEIISIKDHAFKTDDELKALHLSIEESRTRIDVSGAERLFEEASTEFRDERYDRADQLIEASYSKLFELEARSTTAAALYDAATATVGNFFSTFWKEILVLIAILSMLFLVSYKQISIYRLRRKMMKLELEKASLEKLIQRTQRDYFEKGNLPESTYTIRIKKFGDLIRDINRQVPLLKEQIEHKKGKRPGKLIYEKRLRFDYATSSPRRVKTRTSDRHSILQDAKSAVSSLVSHSRRRNERHGRE